MGIPKVTLICAKEIKVKSLLCTSLRSGGTVPYILTATIPRESPPLLTEQEAGWGPEPVCRSWRREKMSVGNEMMAVIADQTNNSPSIWQNMFISTWQKEQQLNYIVTIWGTVTFHLVCMCYKKFNLPYWQEFEQQQQLRVIFKWKIKHIIWILFCHWLLLIFVADQDQLLALNVWSSSWHQIQIHGPNTERELHLNIYMDNDLCLNRSLPSPIPLKNTASLLHNLPRFGALPGPQGPVHNPLIRVFSFSPLYPANIYIFSFSFYLFLFLHLYSLSSLISLFNKYYHFQIHFFDQFSLPSLSIGPPASLPPSVRKFHITPPPTFISIVFFL